MSHEFYFWLSEHKFGLVQLQVCFSCSLEKPGQAVVMVSLSLHITLQIHHLAKTLLLEVHLTSRGACIQIRLAPGLLQIVFSSIRGPEYGFHSTVKAIFESCVESTFAFPSRGRMSSRHCLSLDELTRGAFSGVPLLKTLGCDS